MQRQENNCFSQTRARENIQQHLCGKQTRRASRNGRILPRCFYRKMERTRLSAFTGRSLTTQRYILKNKRLSRHFHTKAPDKCVSAVGRRRVDIRSLTDVLSFLQKNKKSSVNTSQKPKKPNLQVDSIVQRTCIIEFGCLLGFPTATVGERTIEPNI